MRRISSTASSGFGKKFRARGGGNAVESAFAGWKISDACDDEGSPGIAASLTGRVDEWLGRIASDHGGGASTTADRLAESARAAPDVEPVGVKACRYPLDEPRCEESAPSTHEGVV